MQDIKEKIEIEKIGEIEMDQATKELLASKKGNLVWVYIIDKADEYRHQQQ